MARNLLKRYSLQRIDSQLVRSTHTAWSDQLTRLSSPEDYVLVSHYERILLWIQNFTDGLNVSKGENWYGLVDVQQGYPVALLELIHARPESDAPWLKLLNLYVEPRLDVEKRELGDSSTISEAAEVVVASITEALILTFEDLPSAQLKIYGRTEQMKGFFEGLVATFDDPVPGIKVKLEGRWLVFDKRS
jgi:hypothetical protein